MDVKNTFDEFAALPDVTTDFIVYVAGVLRGSVDDNSMNALIQMQTKIFTEINIIKTKQEWLENQFMEMHRDSPPRQH